jgi:hypothetical protein
LKLKASLASAEVSAGAVAKADQKQITQKACEYLTELQMKHSKSLFLHQESSMKEYLTTDQLTVAQKQLLFKLRSRVTPNKSNYKNKYKNDMSCTLCKDNQTEENVSHLLCRPFLTQLVTDIVTIQCQDIFGNLEQQVKAVKNFEKIFKIYDKENEIE